MRRNLRGRLFIEGAWIRIYLYLHAIARVQLCVLSRYRGSILDRHISLVLLGANGTPGAKRPMCLILASINISSNIWRRQVLDKRIRCANMQITSLGTLVLPRYHLAPFTLFKRYESVIVTMENTVQTLHLHNVVFVSSYFLISCKIITSKSSNAA